MLILGPKMPIFGDLVTCRSGLGSFWRPAGAVLAIVCGVFPEKPRPNR